MKTSTPEFTLLRDGMRDGLPIGLGYFAVAFSLGISARSSGLNALQGFFASLFTIASAGEKAGFDLIGEDGGLIAMVLVTLVASGRYLLMSCAYSLRIPESMPLRHRIGIGFFLTDEIFGCTIGRPGSIKPVYTYGAGIVAVPMWAVGTALGIIVGNVLPVRIVTALSVALYGMFLAIIVPPARQSRVILCTILTSFALSGAAAWLLPALSGGNRTIILTILISAGAALLFPVKEEEEAANE